jgi:stage V sporulation protein K
LSIATDCGKTVSPIVDYADDVLGQNYYGLLLIQFGRSIMANNYVLELRKVFNDEVLKVFIGDLSLLQDIQSLIGQLPSVRTANITSSQHGSNPSETLTVHPNRVYSTQEMMSEVEVALEGYFGGGTYDPLFTDATIPAFSDAAYFQIGEMKGRRMSYAEEFQTVDKIINSNAVTLGVDAFALTLIKAERQIRKLFTYLIFQFPSFTSADVPKLRDTLAQNSNVYFEGFVRGIDALYSRSVQDLIGEEYPTLFDNLNRAISYRNKIFHGQLPTANLTQDVLLPIVNSNRKWCETLANESMNEFGYDGFQRNSFQKSSKNVLQNYKITISTLDEYGDFIRANLVDEVEDQPESQNVSSRVSFDNKVEGESKNLDDLTSELNSLVGLDRVKKDVVQLVNFLKVQQMREANGLGVQPLSRHLVFYGNPGTGKTTVARRLSQIYKSLGILSKGHLIETDRTGLVAGYMGQTALKVSEVVSKAIGGVLFIDEAYTLSTGGDNDFGREAIDTLIKMMEDNRDDLIVVVAGYTNKMSSFLQTNPGLRSRFNKYLEFDDYTPEQLVQIFKLFCAKGGYNLALPTSDDLIRLFSVLYETRDETFGNGRLARNLYEMTINNQANRIVSLPQVNDEILSTIEEMDIPGMADMQSIR